MSYVFDVIILLMLHWITRRQKDLSENQSNIMTNIEYYFNKQLTKTQNKEVGVSEKLKPCPFCGETPKLSYHGGTVYEIECDVCCIPRVEIQICDRMTIEERIADDFKDNCYGDEFVKRCELEAVEIWNKRMGLT